ncbi:MAG: hypothetical protein WC506_04330 [Candidatus Micrarchaeia archaeon]
MVSAREYLLILDASFSYAWRSIWQSVQDIPSKQEINYDLGIASFYRETRAFARSAGIGPWRQFYSEVKNNLACNGLDSYKSLYAETERFLLTHSLGELKRYFSTLKPLVKGYAAMDALAVKAYGTFNELSGIIEEQVREKGFRKFKKEFNNRGVQVAFDRIRHTIPPAVADFVEKYYKDSYNATAHFTIHRAVEDKTLIGCPTEAIAETIIYMDKAGNNNFFVFTRFDKEFQIPRSVIKTAIGHKDIAKAAKLAEENLMNECHTGVMGPFFIKPGDKIFFCSRTLDYYADTTTHYANFSAGTLMESMYISMPNSVDVFRKHNSGQTYITEIDDGEKFKIFYKRITAPPSGGVKAQAKGHINQAKMNPLKN